MLNEREDGSLRYGVLGEIVCGVVGSELRDYFLLDSTIVSFLSLCIYRHLTTVIKLSSSFRPLEAFSLGLKNGVHELSFTSVPHSPSSSHLPTNTINKISSTSFPLHHLQKVKLWVIALKISSCPPNSPITSLCLHWKIPPPLVSAPTLTSLLIMSKPTVECPEV